MIMEYLCKWFGLNIQDLKKENNELHIKLEEMVSLNREKSFMIETLSAEKLSLQEGINSLHDQVIKLDQNHKNKLHSFNEEKASFLEQIELLQSKVTILEQNTLDFELFESKKNMIMETLPKEFSVLQRIVNEHTKYDTKQMIIEKMELINRICNHKDRLYTHRFNNGGCNSSGDYYLILGHPDTNSVIEAIGLRENTLLHTNYFKEFDGNFSYSYYEKDKEEVNRVRYCNYFAPSRYLLLLYLNNPEDFLRFSKITLK